MTIWNRSAKVKELGCEEWKGGIRVYAKPMESFGDFVGFGRSSDGIHEFFTVESDLTNDIDGKIIYVDLAPSSTEIVAFTNLFDVTTPDKKVKTAIDKLSSFWFEQSFQNGNDNIRVIFIKSQSLNEDGNIDSCHGCGAEIAAVTYKQINTEWKVVSKQEKISDIGAWGDAPKIKQAKIIQLTSDSLAFLITDSFSQMGLTSTGERLYVFSKNNWRDVGFIEIDSDNSGNCEFGANTPKCWSYEGKISVVGGNKEYPDLLITRTGTQLADKGDVIPVKNASYFFDGNQYKQVKDD
jgi:hypothetical protein